ncbi:MAG: hypothetical protein Q7S53_00830 [bacterium]|nr:hypothetical protein [bacterium]
MSIHRNSTGGVIEDVNGHDISQGELFTVESGKTYCTACRSLPSHISDRSYDSSGDSALGIDPIMTLVMLDLILDDSQPDISDIDNDPSPDNNGTDGCDSGNFDDGSSDFGSDCGDSGSGD